MPHRGHGDSGHHPGEWDTCRRCSRRSTARTRRSGTTSARGSPAPGSRWPQIRFLAVVTGGPGAGGVAGRGRRRRTRWLTAHDPPLMLHRNSPWGPAPIDGLGVELTPTEQQQYDLEWGEFRREMGVARTGSDTARGLAALLRFRQKAGMIRVPHTVDLAAAYVARGYQVVIAAEMVSTAAAPIAEALEARGSLWHGSSEVAPTRRSSGCGSNADWRRSACSRPPPRSASTRTNSSRTARPQPRRRESACSISRGTPASLPGRRSAAHTATTRCARGSCSTARAPSRNGPPRRWWQRLLVAAASVDGDLSTLGAIAELFGAEWLPSDALASGTRGCHARPSGS